ncbi:MAG: glycosyltransferase [Deltaproteobacteria bacterium]|nr:glycosyltransferase [Deltaproteobacteria bacterium]
MRILMLGWEYPPHISGGLGTACEGLTVALARCGILIDFIVPRLSGDERAEHMLLVDSMNGPLEPEERGSQSAGRRRIVRRQSVKGVRTMPLPSLLSPYLNAKTFDELLAAYMSRLTAAELPPEALASSLGAIVERDAVSHYGHDIFDAVARYTSNVLSLSEGCDFDVIHAHDWMTFPAAIALSRLSGKPMVAHVHSLEYDRSGANVNPQIQSIEKLGIEAADAVIAVSYYTAAIIQQQHAINGEKISVVHNGVYPRRVIQKYRRNQGWPSKVVLFLGRITFQKGPDYFVEAAAKVIPHVPDVMFVMAGSGDMLNRMVDRVHQLGIAKNFHFPGFLKGEEVEEMFSVADLYVMPSVSEPFGISALEAINYDTPVIISRQSGVSEVLGHALKVDFWDIDRMSDLIINGLMHEELRQDMVSMAREELRRLRWDASALKTIEVYRRLL